MNKLNIKMKILLPTIILVFVAFTALTTIIMIQFNNTSIDFQDKYVEEFAESNLYEVKALLEVSLDEARSLATSFGEAQRDNTFDREKVVAILEEWLKDNEGYLGVFTAWEPNAFDGKDSQYVNKNYHDSTGRFVPYILKDGNSIVKEALVDYETMAYYRDPKNTRNENVTNPYEYVAAGKKLNLVSMSVPIIVDGEFLGIVGVDVSMEELQGLVDDTTLFDSGYVVVLSNDGTIVAHKNRELIGTDVAKYYDAEKEMPIKNSIINGNVFATTNISNINGIESHVIFTSEEVGNTGINWSVCASVPMREKRAATNMGIMMGCIMAVLFLAAIIVILIFITKSLAESLTTNMNKLSTSAKLVSSASTQLASAGQQLSEGSTEQAASIEETSATMDETSSMVKQNAENTIQANNFSKEASRAAAEGSDKMGNMTKSMDELKKSSGEISKIIKVIDEIAFQTNMLALNAAVEAARAGDAGLGFAVVAEEVRNLAQKSAQAAKDTSEIIDRNIELSEQGVLISDDVNVALEEIMTKTNNVNQLMSEIAAASEEQAKGTSQVTEAIGEMEKVVQINAATAEESAASAEELQNQAEALEEVVQELNKLINGDNAKKVNNITLSINKTVSKNSGQESDLSSSKMPKKDKYILSPDDVIPLDDNDGF